MNFKPDFIPTHHHSEPALWFAFYQGRLLTRINGDRFRIPDEVDLETLQVTPAHKLYLGSLDGRPCYAGALEPAPSINSDFKLTNLRALFGRLPETVIWIAGRGNHLLHWHLTNRFCGKCGHPTDDKADERAKICPQCHYTKYPRLSPAVIVAIVKDNKILLARNRNFKGSFYSVLAGFVEPGESLEQCVKREIKEEVGIRVKNVRYFGSQPWPFPDSLMVGFLSDYASGEIVVDGSEIIEAAWFTKDELPQVPPKISIARQLIDWFTAL
jgi:NAD+ diphosphatase